MEYLTETFDAVIHSPKLTDLLSAFQVFFAWFLIEKTEHWNNNYNQ